VSAYIDEHRHRFGVEPTCSVLQFAPRTYYAIKARPLSARALRDAELRPLIARVQQTVTVVNQTDAPIQLHQCRDSGCRSLVLPEVVRAGRTTAESGSSTAHQPFLVTQVGHTPECMDLFFAKEPAQPVRITTTNGLISVHPALTC
jgi:hypothetical protein